MYSTEAVERKLKTEIVSSNAREILTSTIVKHERCKIERVKGCSNSTVSSDFDVAASPDVVLISVSGQGPDDLSSTAYL